MASNDRKTRRAEDAAEQARRDADPIDPVNLAVDDIAGRRQWKRSRIGFLTGMGAVRDAAGSVFGAGRDAKSRTENVAKMAFAPQTGGVSIDASIEDQRERFNASMIANRRNAHDIRRSVLNTYRQFWLLVAIGVAVLGVGFGSLILNGPTTAFLLLDIVFRLIPMPILLALLFRAGYTNWAFRKRILPPVTDYLRDPGGLLPHKSIEGDRNPGGGKAVTAIAIAILAGVMTFAMPTPEAFALNPAPTIDDLTADPAATDLFTRLLSFVVPGIGPIPDSEFGNQPQHEAMKNAFLAFSGTLLVVASMVGGWQIISGMVASAKEGTALGRQYHEVWAPVRVVFGFGMLAPIAGGLCAAQLIVLYLIAWGGNLANAVWTPYIETIAVSASSDSVLEAAKTIEGVNLSISNEIVRQIFEKELCYSTVKAYLERTGGSFLDGMSISSNLEWSRPTTPYGLIGAGGAILNGERDLEYSFDYGPACGSIKTRIRYLGDSPSVEDRAARIFQDAQQAQITAIQAQIRPVADVAGQTYQSRDGGMPRFFNPENDFTSLLFTLTEARRGYAVSMYGAAREAFAITNPTGDSEGDIRKFREEATRHGWASAGVFYITVGRLQNAIYSASTQGAQFTNIDTIAPGAFSGLQSEYLIGSNENAGSLSHFRSWWNTTAMAGMPDISTAALNIASSTGDGWQMLNVVFGGVMNLWQWVSHSDPMNPMQSMIDLGNKLMLMGAGVLGSSGGVEKATNLTAEGATNAFLGAGTLFAPVTGFIAGLVASFMSLAKFAAFGIIAAGAVHAYVIPMVPYIMTSFFVGGMIILTVEALVAAPLWAFFHVRMDGENFVSQVQQPGYMIAFNLILRPSLMIFGLILSFLTFGAMTFFVELTFYPAAKGISASQGVGPIGWVVMIVLVTFIHYQMAIRSFSMITQIPDRVTRWFGQGGENLGEERDSEHSNTFIMGQTSNRIESMAKMGGIKSSINDRIPESRGRQNSEGGGGNDDKGSSPPAGPGGDKPGV